MATSTTKVTAVVEPANVGKPNGILRQASSIGIPSIAVFGGAGTGKSTIVRDELLKSKANPLWLALNNEAALRIPEVADWTVGAPTSWKEFQDAIYKPAINGQLTGFNAVVVDGADILLAMALTFDEQLPREKPNLQMSYLNSNNNVRDALIKLRDKLGALYMIVPVVPDKEGVNKINLNRYAINTIMPLFDSKWFTSAARQRTPDKSSFTGKVIYSVQKNPALAMGLIAGEAINQPE